MPIYPDRFIEELRLRADIVDVVSSYVPLTRAGANYKALCPFHREKTPSFIVSPEKQIFHCFGCGKGGNVFGFVMEYEKVSFPEAVELLARKYNMSLPKRERHSTGAGQGISLRNLYAINSFAANFYHKNLFSKQGRAALEYLRSRGLDIEVIKRFKLGYARNEWDEFCSLARDRKASDKLLLESGLVLASEKGGVHDRFRNRIMFPVFDNQSRVVGFGGRSLGEEQPKYLNTPDTRIFKKSNLLYGLNLARHHTDKGYFFLVEGYMDVIGLNRCGIGNVVACLGTAFGEGHIRLLSRYVRRLVLVFDPDQAGINAAVRAIRLLLPTPLSVQVLFLPGGRDPDEYVGKYGRDSFLSLEQIDGFEFLMETISKKYDMSDLKQKSLFFKELFELINDIENSIIQTGYLSAIARFVGLKDYELAREFASFRKKASIYKDNKRRFSENVVSVVGNLRPKGPEAELIKLAVLYPEYRNEVKNLLVPTDFEDTDLWELWQVILDVDFDIGRLQARVQNAKAAIKPEILSWFNEILFSEVADPEEMIYTSSKVLLDKRDAKKIKVLKEIIRNRSEKGEDTSELLRELDALLKKRRDRIG